jgi:hypothetical protein
MVGVQPHTLGVPPAPHCFGAAQTPQFSVPPQPSDTVPQSSPSPEHVDGVHTHWFAWHFP